MLQILFLVVALYAPVSRGIAPLVAKDYKFFNSATQDMFFARGIAYQPRASGMEDPISDDKQAAWTRDIPLWVDLGINAVRVYQIDASKSHKLFMEAAAAAGVYLMLDLGTPDFSINRQYPAYEVPMLEHHKQVIDEFSLYDNTMLFFAGNEVTNAPGEVTKAAPFVKALVRDLRAYAKTKARAVPVGYAMNDDPSIRVMAMNYFACADPSTHVDVYGMNLYEWCHNNDTFVSSGYAARVQDIGQFPYPIYLSEYGCNLMKPRMFGQVASIYGKDMMDVVFGGVVYEYSYEVNHFGLVQILSPTQTKKMPDYAFFKSALAGTSPSGPKKKDFNPPARPALACPLKDDVWMATAALPATPDPAACSHMVSSLTCVADPATPKEDIGPKMGDVCGRLQQWPKIGCIAIASDGGTGTYGAYCGCAPMDKLSWAFNQYFAKTQTCLGIRK